MELLLPTGKTQLLLCTSAQQHHAQKCMQDICQPHVTQYGSWPVIHVWSFNVGPACSDGRQAPQIPILH